MVKQIVTIFVKRYFIDIETSNTIISFPVIKKK